jgi:hypothetical protein
LNISVLSANMLVCVFKLFFLEEVTMAVEVTMTFYEVLEAIKANYKWSVINGRICGKSKSGELVSPIVAVVRACSPNGPRYSNSLRDIKRAASRLSLPNSFVSACIVSDSTNRGNAQVVRGRLNSILQYQQ